jgi:hypothetical protein
MAISEQIISQKIIPLYNAQGSGNIPCGYIIIQQLKIK